MSGLFHPQAAVLPPPEEVYAQEWYEPVFQLLEQVVGVFQAHSDEESAVIHSWWRDFERQTALVSAGATEAVISEHCFGAALDLAMPAEFQLQPGPLKTMLLADFPQLRLGFRKYRKPDGSYPFMHVGCGPLIPRAVRDAYMRQHLPPAMFPDNEPLYSGFLQLITQRLDADWQPGVTW